MATVKIVTESGFFKVDTDEVAHVSCLLPANEYILKQNGDVVYLYSVEVWERTSGGIHTLVGTEEELNDLREQIYEKC